MPDIVITPNRGTSSNPKIDFTGTSAGTIKLEVLGDGTIAWNGANGSLFSIADSLSGSLMSVNDISGLPAFEVFSDNRVVVGQFGANLLLGKTTSSSNGRLQLTSHTTNTGGIGFGSDVTLFRSAADILKTEDSFHVNGEIYALASGGGLKLSASSTTGLIVALQGGGIQLRNSSNANILTLADNGNVTVNSGTLTATQLISNIAQGTAPLVVTSTTQVSNLNAQYLNGYSSDTANNANTIVRRDGSGNFSAGTITASNISSTTLTQGGTAGHITKEYTFNLSAQSNTQFFPIRLTGTPIGAGGIHTIEVLMDSFGGADPYNHHSVHGQVRGSGWTDLPPFYDVFHNCYQDNERSYLGFYRGTQNCTDVILYVRGGKIYYVKTPSTASVSTTALTVNDSVFAIKDSTGADVSGTSANVSFMVNLITAIQGRLISHNLNAPSISTGTITSTSISTTAGTTNGVRVHSNSGITASGNYMNFFTSQTNGWAFNTNGTGADANTVVVIDAAGDLGIGVTNPTYKLEIGGAAGASGVARIGSIDYTTSTVLSVAPGVINFDAAGVVGGRLKINSSGNIGINNTSPSYKLDVTGDTRISGNLLAHKVASYTTSYPGINSFGAGAIDTAGVTHYETGKLVPNQDFRGVVWTGKHYIFTTYLTPRAYFYDNNFDAINNAYGVSYVGLPVPSGYSSPHGAAWDGRYLWVMVQSASNVKIVGYDIDTSTNATIIAESAAIAVSGGTAYDVEYADGHLYFANSGTLYIYKWNGSTIDQVATKASSVGSQTSQGITYDGSFLWAVQNTSNIYKVKLDGTQVSTITTGFPTGITGWAWNGSNIVAVEYDTRKIYIINTAQQRIDTENLSVMGGNVGIGTTSPSAKLDVCYENSINTTTPGMTMYNLHLTPSVRTAGNAVGITFGADTGSGTTPQAGIYSQFSGSYGTKMYFATTDAYVSGAKTRMVIDHNGYLSTPTGSQLSYQDSTTYIVWSSEPEYSVVDDATDSNYKVMKTFVAEKSGSLRVKFSAYIISGTYYWAWRIRKANSTVLASGSFQSGLDTGETASVHAYRRFSALISVNPGDVITVEMVSSDISGNPVAGNGQTLYLKQLRIYNSIPESTYGSSNVFGEYVGIGTTTPTSRLEVNGTTTTSGAVINYPYGDAFPLQLTGTSFLKANANYYGMLIRSGDANYLSGVLRIVGGSNKRVELYSYEEQVGAQNVVFPMGNVGINEINPNYKLHVNGDIYTNAVLKAGKVETATFSLGFTNNTANRAVDIRFPNTYINGLIEIEVTSGYSYQNSVGVVKKIFSVGTNPTNGIWNTTVTRVVEAHGVAADNWTIGDFAWDATNSKYIIPVYHIVSSGNIVNINIRYFSEGAISSPVLPTTTLSAEYTATIPTAYQTRHYVYYNDRLGIGTSAPSTLFQVAGNNVGNFRLDTNGSGGHYYQAESNARLGLGRDLITSAGHITFTMAGGSPATVGSAITMPANSQLGFYTSNGTNLTQRVVIDGSGNVGIGIPSPAAKLDVNGNVNINGIVGASNGKLSLGILDINSSVTPSYIKINTTIPAGSTSSDFTVTIKGFYYNGARSMEIRVSWHYYLSQFWNACATSSGGWAPEIKLSEEGGFVKITLTSPGYWPKLFVESVYSSAYGSSYSTGWSWTDAAATNSPVTVIYVSDFGNSNYAFTSGLYATNFVDASNSNYWCDPNGTSILRNIQIGPASGGGPGLISIWEAESLNNTGGAINSDASASSGQNWGTSTNTQLYGPYVNLPRGNYRFTARIKVADASYTGNSVRIQVLPIASKVVSQDRYIRGVDFSGNDVWETFSIPFKVIASTSSDVEFYVFGLNSKQIYVDYIAIFLDTDSHTQQVWGNLYANGNVGIGTTTPNFKFQVAGAGSIGDGAFIVSGNTASSSFYDQNTGAYFHTPGAMIRKDSSRTTPQTSEATLVLYNKNGTDATNTKLVFANNETTSTSANPVATAAIVSEKVSGTAGGWAVGNLQFLVKNGANYTNSVVVDNTGVTVAGALTVQDGTESTNTFGLKTFTKSLTVTTSWSDVGISGSDLATGTYIIQVTVDNYDVSGGQYSERYSGVMSWTAGGTNSTDVDEIVLHKAGHAPNTNWINLRTVRQLGSGAGVLKLQIIASGNTSAADNYVFKFRRMI